MPRKPTKAITVGVDDRPEQADIDQPLTEVHIAKVATLKDLRKATQHTQDDLAHAMGVGQGTVSRIEKRSDMLVSTLQHYVEGVGGTLQLLATFPDRPALLVECLGKKASPLPKNHKKELLGSHGQTDP